MLQPRHGGCHWCLHPTLSGALPSLKVCGLSSVVASWFLEGDVAIESFKLIFGALRLTSQVPSSSIIFKIRWTSLDGHVAIQVRGKICILILGWTRHKMSLRIVKSVLKCMCLKLPRHTCVNCIWDQGLVEMYMKTELQRTTLHTHTLICRVIKESMETMKYSHIIFFSYCTWKAMELARARKTRRGNEAL